MTEKEKLSILKKAFNEQNLRIYEYLDDEGRVFWSFTETKLRTHVYRLRLVDRTGLNFLRWVYELRNLIRASIRVQDSKKPEQEQIIRTINWGKKGIIPSQKRRNDK